LFDDNIGGYIIPPDNVAVIADRLRSALSNDYLVDNAAEANWHTIKKRLNQNDFSNRVWNFYNEIFQDMDT
jgi:flagellar biosynthesis regulator FlaF